MKLLLVEDNKPLAECLALELESEGYAVQVAADGASALLACRRSPPPDLMILDLDLQDFSGIDVCRRLRLGGADLPILMLTGRIGVAHRVEGLKSGADDYLEKPFSFEELLARLEALLRRVSLLPPVVDPLPLQELAASLSRRELEVLQLMVRGQSNGEIAAQLVLSSETVKSHVKGIFRKLDVHDRTQAILQALQLGLVKWPQD